MKYTFSQLVTSDALKARELCLRNIKDTFGDEYHPRWAHDLDSLGTAEDYYRENRRGIFFVAKLDDTIVGTLGIRSFQSQEPYVPQEVITLYASQDSVAYITRLYVESSHRGKGIGKELVSLGESFCNQFYQVMYLHTHLNPVYDSARFWKDRGYNVIFEETTTEHTIHMDKKILF